MPEETNPESVEETTPATEQTTSPQGSESTEVVESSPESAEASQETVSLEQLQQQNADLAKKVEDLNKGFTQSSQDRSRFQQENEQLRGMVNGFVNKEQQAADPLIAINERYQEALFASDAAAMAAADRERMQFMAQGVLQDTVRVSRAATSMDRATAKYGYDANQLAEGYVAMQNDPELVAKALSIRDGKYEDISASDRVAAEQEALRATAVGRLVGEGTPGAVPGGLESAPQQFMDWMDFAHQPPEVKKKLLESGVTIRGAPRELVEE